MGLRMAVPPMNAPGGRPAFRGAAAALLAAVALGAAGCPAAAADPSPDAVAFFENHVRPLLLKACAECHGPTRQRASLRLDSREAVLRGGDSGPAAVPGKPSESLLVQ